MSSQIPPNPYFSGINYNPGFFSSITDYLTEAIANSKYLKLLGGTLGGFLGILRTPRVALDVNGKAVINDGTSGIPVVATLGGSGTKIILGEGTAGQPPIALGTESSSLWYGAGIHRFYTGTNERMRIDNNGNVGIGTNNPAQLLDIYSDISTINPICRIRANVARDAILMLERTGSIWQIFNKGTGFGTTANNLSIASLSTNNILELTPSGNVGIGTNDPQSKLHLHSTANNADISFRITDNTSGAGATDGIAILKTNLNDMFLQVFENARMYFFTNNLVRMNILANGNVGIGAPTPDTISQIFQVGSGQRLRISNNSTDYSQIGSIDTLSPNNTSIVLSGHQRSVQTGNIEYQAVNEHVFYTTNTGSYIDRIRINPDDFQIKTSCSTYGANYYTDGEYLALYTRTNTAGTVKTGYFISNEWFYNSLVMLAASHNGPTYTYWHGYYGTNNSTATMYVTALNQSNMTVEAFQEQTTLKYWLFLRPSVSFNISDQMRVKFYG